MEILHIPLGPWQARKVVADDDFAGELPSEDEDDEEEEVGQGPVIPHSFTSALAVNAVWVHGLVFIHSTSLAITLACPLLGAHVFRFSLVPGGMVLVCPTFWP